MHKSYICSLSIVYTLMARGLSTPEIEARHSLPRRMKFTEFESEVTKSGNSGHVIVPKDWIGKKVKVSLLEEE
jgi:putative transposon-encoded protein